MPAPDILVSPDLNSIDVIAPNIVEFNLRQLGATLDPHTSASFRSVGAALADESVLWSDNPRVQLLHPDADLRWYADVHESAGLEPPPLVTPRGAGMLIADLLRDPEALSELRAHVDGHDHVRLLSWGATRGIYLLSAALRSWGHRVSIDVPADDDYWTSLYLESKLSCLDLAQRVPGFRVPPGVIVMSWEEAEGAVRLLLRRGSAAMVKAIHGVGGTGTEVVGRDGTEAAAFWRRLAEEPYFRQFPLLVQQFITHAPGLGCPAVDLNVCETGCGEIFSSVMSVTGHRFQSVKLGPGILPASVDEEIMELGRRVGDEAAELGFRGWLGIDFLVSSDGLLYATEINARRTTGMHPIALALRWGVEKTVVRAESLCTPPGLAPCSYHDIQPAFQDMWRSGARVLPTTVRCLSRQTPAFGIVTVASTPAETDAIADELAGRIGRLQK